MATCRVLGIQGVKEDGRDEGEKRGEGRGERREGVCQWVYPTRNDQAPPSLGT